MKFIKIRNQRGTNFNHGTKFVVTDLSRSKESVNIEAGTNRLPRSDSKVWNHDFMVWNTEINSQVQR